MKVPSNFYIIAVPKQQKLSENILAPVHKGTEENDLKPTNGRIVALPVRFSKGYGIASNTAFGNLNAAMLENSVSKLKEGDEVYVSYLGFDDENFFDSTETEYLYRIPVHHLIATKNPLKAIAGKVLIRPEVKPEFHSDVLISTNNKKMIAHGSIVSASEGMPDKFVSGQRVAYMERLAEWIEIEGRKLDFVYTHEILGIL